MNDQFLYDLRRPPPPAFSRRLKRQLDQQASQRTNRFSLRRTLLTLFLIGGSALAGAYLAMNSRFGPDDEARKPVVVAEQRPAANPLQTTAPAMVTESVEAAADVDGDGSERRDESYANAQPSTTQSSTSPSNAQASTGAVRGGYATAQNDSSREPAGPRLVVVTSYLAHSLTRAVVDTFSRDLRVKPVVDIRTEESVAAFKTLCPKAAAQPIDVVVASRRITDDEREQCRRAGVPELLEFKIGYQAVVLARGTTGSPIQLSARSIYLALAQQIPDPIEPAQLIDNPNRTWNQIEPSVDSRPIEVFGPVPGTQLRRAIEVIVLGAACDTYPGIQALQESDPERYAEVCYSVRADGLYQEVGQTVTMVSQNLLADPHAIAIVDYNFYRGQRAHLAGSVLADVEPTDATLADGTYPLARPVYVYANSERARVKRISLGSKLFWEFVERASTPYGYLLRGGGLTPISEQEREAQYEGQQIPMRGSWTGP
jgi:phosphate transport system substrate-binding protein